MLQRLKTLLSGGKVHAPALGSAPAAPAAVNPDIARFAHALHGGDTRAPMLAEAMHDKAKMAELNANVFADRGMADVAARHHAEAEVLREEARAHRASQEGEVTITLMRDDGNDPALG